VIDRSAGERALSATQVTLYGCQPLSRQPMLFEDPKWIDGEAAVMTIAA